MSMAEREIRAGITICDFTPLVRKIHALIQAGAETKARALLPRERVYPVSETIAKRLGM